MDFSVNVNVKTNGKEQVDALERQIEQLRQTPVTVKIKTNGDSELSSLKRQISSLKNHSVNFKVNASSASGIKNIKNDFQILKNLANEISQKRIKIAGLDTNKNANQIRELSTQLSKLQSDYKVLYSTLGKNLNASQVGQLENIFGKASDRVNELNAKTKDLAENMTRASKPFNTLDASIASNKTLSWLRNNTKAAKEFGDTLETLAQKQKNATSTEELRGYNKEFRNIVAQAQASGLTGKSRISEFKRAAGQIAEFAGVYGAIQNVVFEVPRQIAQAVMQVDSAMTNLQMATGVSNDQAQQLMSTYAQLGNQLKATSTDVAASATEWLKQGKSIAESQKLAEDSIILSKIGDLSSEEATKTITAAMKSYNLTESEVMGFVDQISAIDMASATDVGGLATAFNEVAANAKQAGVSTQELLSYAAAIGETTQEGMASVGTSLNAIFSRMGNIKLARLKDYENNGEDLSNVETVLRGVGISLRSSATEFRDFDEVLDETASRWTSFSGVQQRAVAQAFAGTNHMNEFMVLMQQWGNVEKYIQTADESSGESLEKYEAYTNSIEGKLEGLKNSAQTLSTATLNSDMFKGAIDGATAFLDVLTSIMEIGGGIPALLGTIGGISIFKNLDQTKSCLYLNLLLSGSTITKNIA